ncbi:hypothetical protein [Yersinia proxima]|uniref:hypothetical protein n=1 Tax=Yersinia proxima TaxID=2890316 RepID=UPI001D121A9D|nr:hypothetical protein [Yersinia proxima]
MEELNQEIHTILTKAEYDGSIGSSNTANLILDAFKRRYHDPIIAASAKDRIEALKKEPGVSFPANYEEILSR